MSASKMDNLAHGLGRDPVIDFEAKRRLFPKQ